MSKLISQPIGISMKSSIQKTPVPIVFQKNTTESPSLNLPDPVIKVDAEIINFFETNCIDPIKFIKSSIQNYLPLSHDDDVSKKDWIQFQKEYDIFINKKKSLVHHLRESAKQLDSIDFEYLNTYLCHKTGTIKNSLECVFCNNFYHNKKALAVHQRKCKKEEDGTEKNEEEE